MATTTLTPGAAPANADASEFNVVEWLLTMRERAMAAATDPSADPQRARIDDILARAFTNQLAKQGVTVSGGIGHA